MRRSWITGDVVAVTLKVSVKLSAIPPSADPIMSLPDTHWSPERISFHASSTEGLKVTRSPRCSPEHTNAPESAHTPAYA